MTTAELKLKLFRQIDSLESTRLQDLYGVIENYLNGQKDIDDWGLLTEDQQQGILTAIDEIDTGKGIEHDKIITKYRQKYTHA